MWGVDNSKSPEDRATAAEVAWNDYDSYTPTESWDWEQSHQLWLAAEQAHAAAARKLEGS